VSLLSILEFAAEDFWKASELLALLAGLPELLMHPNVRANATMTMNKLLKHLVTLKLQTSRGSGVQGFQGFRGVSWTGVSWGFRGQGFVGFVDRRTWHFDERGFRRRVLLR
jgi:hypothetical protein